jgi:Fe-S oxidoreductase
VTVFAGCHVEHLDVQVGKDLVGVYERNGIECAIADAGCCGATSLHAGDLRRFRRVATATVRSLAARLRDGGGGEVVVPQPTCAHVLRHDIPRYVDDADRADALLVAERTRDAVEHLARVHAAGPGLDTRFEGEVPATIAYHVPCHLRAQRIGVPARDLMALTGADVRLVERCSGNDGAWGLLTGNEDLSVPLADRLATDLGRPVTDVVAGDCSRANLAIAERTGSAPSHPLSVLARAYGIAADA